MHATLLTPEGESASAIASWKKIVRRVCIAVSSHSCANRCLFHARQSAQQK
jgi:hypothetical protein